MQWPHLLIGTEKERGQRCCLTKKTKITAPRAGGRGDVWHRGFQRGVDRRRSETRAVVPRGIQRRGRHGTIVPSPGRRCVRARGGSIDARVPSRGMRRGGDRGIEAAGVRGSGRSETHQGARNLTKAALPDSRTSASKFFAVRSTAPALAPTTRPIRAIARNATRILTCGGRTRGADQSINSRDGPTADRNSRSGGGRRANRGETRAMRPRGRRWAIETVHTTDGTRTGSELARSRMGHCRNFCSFCPSAACHVFRPIRSEYLFFVGLRRARFSLLQ